MPEVRLSLPEALRRANAAHAAGLHGEAEKLCRAALGAVPDHFDALHLLAVVQSSRGARDDALKTFDRVLALRPDHPDVHNNRGKVLQNLKRFDEALASFDRAIAIRSNGSAASDNADAHNSRGILLGSLKRYDEALVSFDRALKLRPETPETHNNRGAVLLELGRLEEALASLDRALALRADYADAHYNRGLVLAKLGKFDEAISAYDRAIAARPDYASAFNNRGLVLVELKRPDEALACYDRAIALRADYVEAFNNRGVVLTSLGRLDDAVASFDSAIALQPDRVEAHNNRGNALKELTRFDDALASYRRAIALRPDYSEANWNEGLTRLMIGDFERGWPKYEWRWKRETFTTCPRDFGRPQWQGEETIAGKTILLHSEQGFGDAIQFCRYVPLVAARGAHVVLESPKALLGLMAGLEGATQVIAKGSDLPPFDLHCPLLSLPLAFGTRLDTIPAQVPYLRPSPADVDAWRKRLGPGGGPRVGLVWSGQPTHKNDHNRSMGLRTLLPLLQTGVKFVSLQKAVRAEDAALLAERHEILHFGDALQSFSDTAALVSQLDLVISVDTSVAHLAGALARPVWILLPYIPDWRWLLDREDCPWYPTARLFRQDESRSWSSVMARVTAALAEFAGTIGRD